MPAQVKKYMERANSLALLLLDVKMHVSACFCQDKGPHLEGVVDWPCISEIREHEQVPDDVCKGVEHDSSEEVIVPSSDVGFSRGSHICLKILENVGFQI